MQGIEKWPYLFIYFRIHIEKDRKRGQQIYEIGKFLFWFQPK